MDTTIWTAKRRSPVRMTSRTGNGDSGTARGGLVPTSQWGGPDDPRIARVTSQTYRCACCGHAVQHPEPAELRELARRHAAACGRAA